MISKSPCDAPRRSSHCSAKPTSSTVDRARGSTHSRSASSESSQSIDSTSVCESSRPSIDSSLNHLGIHTKRNAAEAPIPYHLCIVQFNYCPCLIPRDGASYIAMLIPSCIASDADKCKILREASPSPPTTLATLAELELKWIQNNIHLRVDVNYEYDLHFMPIKGQKGQEKRLQAERYWAALELEFQIYAHNSTEFCNACSNGKVVAEEYFIQRLPVMFENLRELLVLLVPDRDQDEVAENLDVSLLMQQVRHGVLDIARLSVWLEGLLTSHCAPIRDEKAGEMREKLAEGASRQDSKALVNGLEQLFAFLEAMKLDVANHQIRTFRLLLIEETITWQQDYFEARINEGKFDVNDSRDWYTGMQEKFKLCRSQTTLPEDFLALLYGLVMTTALGDSEYPKTLTYDTHRLKQIHTEIQDIIHIEFCLRAFNGAIRPCIRPHTNLADIHSALRTSFMYLTDAEAASNKPVPDIWLSQVEPIAVEIDRAANAMRRAANHPERQEYIRMASHLSNAIETERRTRSGANKLLVHLTRQTSEFAKEFWKMTPLQIAEKQRLFQQERQSGPQRYVSNITDVARKLAHTSVLHWRVWARLAYVKEENIDLEVEEIGVTGTETEADFDVSNAIATAQTETEDEGLIGAWDVDSMDVDWP